MIIDSKKLVDGVQSLAIFDKTSDKTNVKEYDIVYNCILLKY